MRYLAISKTPYYVAYAFFKGVELHQWGSVKLTEPKESKRLLEWEQIVVDMVHDLKPQFLLTHLLDKERIMKKDLERIIEIRTILKLVSEKNNVMYNEFKTSGWEKRITNNRATDKKKIKIIRDGYDIEIDDVEVANAIILAEGVAHNRLQIGK